MMDESPSSPSKPSLPAIPAKRYFTIGEVSELCGVKPHVLRYWEQEFTQLKPVKRRGNRRYYQHHEVLLIRRIRQLLYEEGFTISGARHRLDQAVDQQVELVGKHAGVRDRHRGQPHDRAVAARPGVRAAGARGVAGFAEALQRGAGRNADVKAAAVDGIGAAAIPAQVALSLVVEVPADVGDAVGQGEGHAGVVGPFTGVEPMRPAAAPWKRPKPGSDVCIT